MNQKRKEKLQKGGQKIELAKYNEKVNGFFMQKSYLQCSKIIKWKEGIEEQAYVKIEDRREELIMKIQDMLGRQRVLAKTKELTLMKFFLQ